METHNYYEQFWEYLLLVPPPDDVKKSIGNIKKEVGIKYGSARALNSAAHINLIKFVLLKGYEKSLLTQLFAFCINRMAFEIRLNNFDVFPRHTLYVNIRENDGLKKLQNGLIMMLVNSISIRGKDINASKKFYMTIAGSLNPGQFAPIACEYKNRFINTSFQAKNVLLLKRPYDEYNSKSGRWNGSHNFVMGC
jgi:2'-5' RNA ligase